MRVNYVFFTFKICLDIFSYVKIVEAGLLLNFKAGLLL